MVNMILSSPERHKATTECGAACSESLASLKSARSLTSARLRAACRRGSSLFARLPSHVKFICTNSLCIFIFLAYAFFGGCVLLYLEHDHAEAHRRDALFQRFRCVADTLDGSRLNFEQIRVDASHRHALARNISQRCLANAAQSDMPQREWNLKSAFLFGFGLLTTLGYGKVFPHTTSSQMFAVTWGLLGVPFAVIILSNLGLYLRFVERFLRKKIRHCGESSTTVIRLHSATVSEEENLQIITKTSIASVQSTGVGPTESNTPKKHTLAGSLMRVNKDSDVAQLRNPEAPQLPALAESSRISVRSKRSEDLISGANTSKSEWNILPISLALFVLMHLTLGAIFLPLLNTSQFDFINGFYYCYICFTGMEYGALINHENAYFPIVLVYNCVGLAMSTIVLNVSSTYAKKLYYCSRRVGDFAQAKIWIGSKHLRVKELLSALSQTIGVDPDAFQQLDLDQMIENAILVKEGRLSCVPQAYTFLEGIWPPELVPLFLRDGCLPDYVDEDRDETKRSAKDNAKSWLTIQETSALRAAIALSTFANGSLHRTLCPTAPLTATLRSSMAEGSANKGSCGVAFNTAEFNPTEVTSENTNPRSESKFIEKRKRKRRVSNCVNV